MIDYLAENSSYWNQGTYDAPNVESHIFRLPGIHFRKYGIPCSAETKVLDFGCGQGSAVLFFVSKGCDAYGVDISEKDIRIAKDKVPDLKDHFKIIQPKPSQYDEFFKIKFDFIMASQSLYYYSDEDLKKRIKSLWNMLNPGGYVYFTMMSTKSSYFQYTEKEHNGLYKVDIQNKNYKERQENIFGKSAHAVHYVLFTHDEHELKQRFKLFKPLEVCYYDLMSLEEEGSGHHYTFFGRKE